MDRISLETERLILRNFQKDDWKDLYEYLSLAETYVYEPGNPVSIGEAKRLAKERSKGDAFLAVVLKAENKMIGHLYFHREEPLDFYTWELGYIFNPRYQNRGFCTEASRKAVEFGFFELKAHRINAYCDPLNAASWHVLEKIGMEREGHFRKKAFFRRDEKGDPIWHDCYAYGIVEEDIGTGPSRA
jgi:RimJ/RimL family protein N-acetyltransferase